MDHIPNVNGQGLDIKIPYLLGEGSLYDRKGWESYPKRVGYPRLAEDISVQELNVDYAAFKHHEFQAVAQAWMVFGVLHEFLGDDFSEEDFTMKRLDAEGWRIRMYSLQEWSICLNRDNRAILTRPTYPDKIIDRQRLLYLPKVHAKCLLWDLFAKDKDQSWVELALSFRLVYEAIAFLLQQMEQLQRLGSKVDTTPTNGPSLDLIRAHFQKSKTAWCVHQVDYLCTRLSYSALVYLTGFSRTSREGIDHSSCGLHASCVAYNVEIGFDFVTKHTEPDCMCKHVEAPHAERTKILQRGGIAVLNCRQDQDGSFDLNFLPASPDVKYAAISHLWSDGLGNAFGNSLPFCQLTRLVDAVRATDKAFHLHRKQTLIWLDVYCVPAQIPKAGNRSLHHETLEEQIQKELKQRAIARMGATYAWAKYVLVIDHELMRVATKENGVLRPTPKGRMAKPIEGPKSANTMAIASVAVSAWNTRCWTYQEHALAKRSIVQGAGCQLQIDSLSPKSYVEANLQQEFLGLASRQSLMGGVFTRNAEQDPPSDVLYSSMFSRAWNAFRGRNTSQWKDMIAVLATLLDLDAAALLKLHPKDRMKAILGSQSTIPLSLLLVAMDRSGPSPDGLPIRLQDRWIPEHIQSVHLQCPRGGDLIQVRDQGLFLGLDRLVKNAARMIRVPLKEHRLEPHFHYSFRSDGLQSRFWLDVDNEQIEACVKVSYWEPTDVILILELLDSRIDIDHSITLRGACLMPAGPADQVTEPAIFICALEWGLDTVEDNIKNRDRAAFSAAASPLSSDPPGPEIGVLIQSNIAAWPKLPRAGSYRFKTLRWARRSVAVLVPAWCIALALIPLIGWGFSLGVVVLDTLLCALIHGLAYIIQLQIMYSMHPELDNSSSWRRRYLAIFRLLRFRDISWYHWPAHIVLWVLVMFISVPDLVVRNAKQMVRYGRKGDESQHVQLEALL